MPATVLRYYAFSVFALYKYCSGNSALVRHFAFFFFFFFFFLNSSYSARRHCSYSSYSFFSFVFHMYFLFFPFIYIVLLHNKFHNIFIIIEMSISYKSK